MRVDIYKNQKVQGQWFLDGHRISLVAILLKQISIMG